MMYSSRGSVRGPGTAYVVPARYVLASGDTLPLFSVGSQCPGSSCGAQVGISTGLYRYGNANECHLLGAHDLPLTRVLAYNRINKKVCAR